MPFVNEPLSRVYAGVVQVPTGQTRTVGKGRWQRSIPEMRDVVQQAYCAYSTAGAGDWPGGRAALSDADPGGSRPVSLYVQERLLTMMSMRTDTVERRLSEITVGQFRGMQTHLQMRFINECWNQIAIPYAFSTPVDRMWAPGYDDPPGVAPLPSAWCPRPGMPTLYHKRLRGRDAWLRHQVGFRIDGSNTDSMNRVTGRGMTRQVEDPVRMRNAKGMVLQGTVMDDPNLARYWVENQDIFNETAVCLSRNFFGGTAFPERKTDHRSGEFCLLWAVDCRGMTGFDTEDVQRRIGKHWRPGEKAFPSIPPDRIFACVKLQRRGGAAGAGWSFLIAGDENWMFFGNRASLSQRAYIIDELAAWRGTLHSISPDYDFARQR